MKVYFSLGILQPKGTFLLREYIISVICRKRGFDQENSYFREILVK